MYYTMENLIFTPNSFDQIKSEISDTVRREISTLLTSLEQPRVGETAYLTRREAARFLNVSLVTLHDWTKSGLIEGYRIGTRVRYKRTALEDSLLKIKTSKTQRRVA